MYTINTNLHSLVKPFTFVEKILVGLEFSFRQSSKYILRTLMETYPFLINSLTFVDWRYANKGLRSCYVFPMIVMHIMNLIIILMIRRVIPLSKLIAKIRLCVNFCHRKLTRPKLLYAIYISHDCHKRMSKHFALLNLFRTLAKNCHFPLWNIQSSSLFTNDFVLQSTVTFLVELYKKFSFAQCCETYI